MKNRKNYKKQNKTKNVLGGIGLVLVASALTLGGVKLTQRNNMYLDLLLKVELNEDFFKDAEKGTETINDDEYVTYSLEYVKNSKIKYEVKLVVEDDFWTDCSSQCLGSDAYIQVTNLNATICEVNGYDSDEEVSDSYLVNHIEATKTTNEYSKVLFDYEVYDVEYINNICFYGIE